MFCSLWCFERRHSTQANYQAMNKQKTTFTSQLHHQNMLCVSSTMLSLTWKSYVTERGNTEALYCFTGATYDFSSKIKPDSLSTSQKTPVNSFSLQSEDFQNFTFPWRGYLAKKSEKWKILNSSQTVIDRRIASKYK